MGIETPITALILFVDISFFPGRNMAAMACAHTTRNTIRKPDNTFAFREPLAFLQQQD